MKYKNNNNVNYKENRWEKNIWVRGKQNQLSNLKTSNKIMKQSGYLFDEIYVAITLKF